MSDAKLRDLERRWKETGSVQDEAAYLLERVSSHFGRCSAGPNHAQSRNVLTKRERS